MSNLHMELQVAVVNWNYWYKEMCDIDSETESSVIDFLMKKELEAYTNMVTIENKIMGVREKLKKAVNDARKKQQ